MNEKEPFKERIEKAKKESAERIANLSPKELTELRLASRRYAEKIRSEIERNYEIEKRKKAD